ncbi:hypothetical protein EJ08DRAFT_734672 [Tothia fuscella]|uniref:Uncharacterized protein n=1 Tax=Tothia fuscella TaxID=1048955 RepID=A0A9P4NQC0_9PEZI|nr:hypothetical protein EJ08DRAFT_734672 [Tothia fuscella]
MKITLLSLAAAIFTGLVAASPLEARIPQLGSPDYKDCQRNIHLDDNACYTLDKKFFSESEDRGDGLSSIGFSGNMFCYLYEADDCSFKGEWDHARIFLPQRDLRSCYQDDVRGEFDFDNRTYSVKCHRND